MFGEADGDSSRSAERGSRGGPNPSTPPNTLLTQASPLGKPVAVTIGGGIAQVSTATESGRQSCFKIDWFSGDGVVEFQKLGVQEISSIAGEAGEVLKRLPG